MNPSTTSFPPLSTPPSDQQEHTFLFADLAGFTALTEAHGDERAADLVTDFSSRVQALLADLGGGDTKTIGDAIMVRLDSARAAVELGLVVIEQICRLPGYPVVRVGMNTGPAVARHGDWYGATVNLAARVSADAQGHEVLLTEATRIAAGELDSVSLEKLGPRRFRNVAEPVTVYRALRWAGDRHALTVDPVCRMAVAADEAAGWLEYEGRRYTFCSVRCAGAFAADPQRYSASTSDACESDR